MTGRCEARAPGKLVLVGEYAVLYGAPAISAAVNCNARATVSAAAECELHIANDDARFRFTTDAAGMPVWQDDPGAQGTALQAVSEALAARAEWPANVGALQVELCSRDFYASGADGTTQKTGIGSSAAIIVALTAALQTFVGTQPALDVCLDAHSRLQKGAGSGIDVATSWYGGVIVMRPDGAAAPAVEQLSWLPGLHVLPVWTGVTASTPALLTRLADYRRGSAAECQTFMQRLRAESATAVAAWTAQDSAAVVSSLACYGELLAELDEAAGIGIWSSCHRQLSKLAGECGVEYKPSGAGGGDFGLAVATDQEKLAMFRVRADEAGFPQSHVPDWAAAGVQVSSG